MPDGRLSRRQLLASGLRAIASASPVVLLSAACGVGCSPGRESPAIAPTAEASEPAASGGMPKRGGILRAVIPNDFVSMWPAIASGPTASRCYDWLVRWRKGADGRWGPRPGLAESWQLDDRSATFKLRKNVKFHDGSDLTAEVVRWNVETWIKHPKSLARTDLQAVATDDPAEVLDESTVKINLNMPAGSLLSALSDANRETAIASKAAYESLGEAGLTRQAVGSGPFVFEQWQSGSQLNLRRNPSYWESGADGQPLPYLDGIVYRFVPDDSTRVSELMAGSADLTELIRGDDVPAVKADSSLTYVEDPTNGRLYRLLLNPLRPPFKDNLKLRQAVQHAIDREAVARALGRGIGVVQRYDLTPGTLGYDESIPFYSFDLAKSRTLIAESGVSIPLPVRLTVVSRDPEQQQGEMLKQMLDRIGIKVSIDALERAAWGQKVREARDFEMATVQSTTAVDPDALSVSWPNQGTAGYPRANEPAIASCLADGRTTYDPARRQQIYKRCQTLMYETAWWGHLWLQPWSYVMHQRVRPTGPMYQSEWHEEVIWLAE